MNELSFITEEVLNFMHSQVAKNSYDIVAVSEKMPTLEGFLTPYLISELDGAKFEVSIEDLYTHSEEYEEFYETLIVEIVKDVLEDREKSY